MIVEASSEFAEAIKGRRISIAIQCGVFCEQALVESSVCPTDLLSLWKLALKDDEAEVRQAAVNGLYYCTPADACDLSNQVRRVADENETCPDRQREAWVVLARLGEQDALHWLAEQLCHDDLATREQAARELPSVDGTKLARHVDMRNVLKDESDHVRVAVARMLWDCESNVMDTIPVLVGVLTNRLSEQRLDAARLLCRMKQSATVALPSLIALRDEEDWTLRLQAVRAVRMIAKGDDFVLDVLTALSNDTNQFVARDAREGIHEFTGR